MPTPPFRELWSRPLHMRAQAMAASGDVLVAAERWTRLVRLDPGSGALLWDQRVEDCWGTVVIAGEQCLYLSQRGVLHSFDLTSGEPGWSLPGLELCRHVSVIGSDLLLGGWRGYRPVTRVGLADGRPLPFDGSALAGAGPLARAWPVDALGAVLIAGSARADLLAVTAAGDVTGRWPLPEPVLFADGGDGFGRADDGRVVFLSGRRTVMTWDPAGGVRVLWRHERDLREHVPLLHDETLWLVDDAGIAVVDLRRRGIAWVEGAAVSAVALIDGVALFARTDRSVLLVAGTGDAGLATRAGGAIDQLVPGENGLVHLLCKGHLVTLTT